MLSILSLDVYASGNEKISNDKNTLNILLLNSYHDGYIWSNELKNGVKDVFDQSYENYNLRIEHMDTKNLSTDAYLEELSNLYTEKFESDEFDLILSADDNALKFLLSYKEKLFGDTPVFFCGVNTLDAHDLKDTKNIYGVVEKSSIKDTIDIAVQHNPRLKNVYLVVDDTITGRSTKADVKRDLLAYDKNLNLIVFEDMTIFEIQEELKKVNTSNSVVIQTFYVVDVDGAVYPLEYTAKLVIEASPVPIYGLYTFGYGYGTVGGKFVEGYSQGSRAAEMAVDYLKTGVPNRDRFIVNDNYNRYHFDYEVMEKYNLNMDILPTSSLIINEPVTIYQQHKSVINISLMIVFLLVVYVLILRVQIASQTLKITKTQKDLMESERMASLGRLVAGVAHEINTPVGIGVTLSSHIESTTRVVGELVSENNMTKLEFEEYIDDLLTSSNHLSETMKRASELVRSFKRVAVDQSTDEHREIFICEYFQEIINSLKNELKQKSVEVQIICDDKMVVWSHAGAIYQIMMNLILNSIIHGFDGRTDGLIEISAQNLSQSRGHKADKVSIKYRDYGVGMSQNDLNNIYEPFYTTKREMGGSGLGMHIVYNLVTQKLGGTIECTSAMNAGTEFLIEFPIESPTENKS